MFGDPHASMPPIHGAVEPMETSWKSRQSSSAMLKSPPMSHTALVGSVAVALQQISEAHEAEVVTLRHEVAQLKSTLASLQAQAASASLCAMGKPTRLAGPGGSGVADVATDRSPQPHGEMTSQSDDMCDSFGDTPSTVFAGSFPRIGQPVKVVAGDDPMSPTVDPDRGLPTDSTCDGMGPLEEPMSEKVSFNDPDSPAETLFRASSMILMRPGPQSPMQGAALQRAC